MMRFKLTVKDVDGNARILLSDGTTIIGIANLSWNAYSQLLKVGIQLLLGVARTSLSKTLATRLWRDAQRLSEDSVELAKQKLATMGWTQEQIESYGDEQARAMMQDVVEMMPEVK
jgi:hypothetical protein